MKTATKNTTQIKAEKSGQDVYIIREFDAPRENVFRAHTDAKLFAKWIGPRSIETKVIRHDARSGGSYRYLNIENGVEHGFNGTFHEVTAPERIIQTFEYEGMPERGHVTLDTTTFEELPGNRTRITIHSVCRSQADRDGMMQSGMEMGVNEGYEKLDELLAGN